jgi:peroxiredoxin
MFKRPLEITALLGGIVLSASILPAIAQSGKEGGGMTPAAIGKPAPDFTLTSPQGKTVTLSKGNGSKATVLMFISTQCPVSNEYNTRMAKVAQDYASKGIRFLGINSNKGESPEEVAKHAREQKFGFPVLIDVGNVVADQYNAKVTPHVYVIDDKQVLRYVGRIDDSATIDKVKSKDLRTTLDALLAGKEVPVAETRAFGCAIKRMGAEGE